MEPARGPALGNRERPAHRPPHPVSLMVGRWIPVLLWMAIIFAFSSTSALPQASNELLDVLIKKSAHFCEFAVLGVLIHRALRPDGRITWAGGIAAIAFTATYAVTDELHQILVPGRHPSPLDVGIDTLGAITAILVLRRFRGTGNEHL
jgi:VanZ family protein